MVPIKFTLHLDGQDESLIGAICQYSYHQDIEEEDLFTMELDGQLVYKDSNLDKIQKVYIEQAINDMVYDACPESLNLFPEARKNLKEFAQKVCKALDAALDNGDVVHHAADQAARTTNEALEEAKVERKIFVHKLSSQIHSDEISQINHPKEVIVATNRRDNPTCGN
jgi:pyruvate formate-lyase activating enzyme-like uncharacterized protein